MPLIISGLATFLLYQMLAGVLYGQNGLDQQSFGMFFPSRSAVPLILLSAGPWIQILILWFTSVYLRHTPAETALFPRVWVQDFGNENMAFFWEKVSAFIILGLPLIGFVYFWIQFPEGAAWHGASGKPVSLWHPAPIQNLLIGFNEFKYGDSGEKGVSYVPLWQPLILMALPLALVLAWTIRLVRRLNQRLPIRQKSVIHGID